MRRQKLTTVDLCQVGVFTAAIAILSQLSIPMPYGVPMTLQTFVIPFAGVVLGARKGAITAAVYVLLGAVGLPVYAGFAGGFDKVIGPTGGFLLTFPLLAFSAGRGAERGGKPALALGLLIGIAINYGAGMLQFSLVTHSTLQAAFIACALPFLPLEAIKAVLVAVLGGKCRRMLPAGMKRAAPARRP